MLLFLQKEFLQSTRSRLRHGRQRRTDVFCGKDGVFQVARDLRQQTLVRFGRHLDQPISFVDLLPELAEHVQNVADVQTRLANHNEPIACRSILEPMREAHVRLRRSPRRPRASGSDTDRQTRPSFCLTGPEKPRIRSTDASRGRSIQQIPFLLPVLGSIGKHVS